MEAFVWLGVAGLAAVVLIVLGLAAINFRVGMSAAVKRGDAEASLRIDPPTPDKPPPVH